MSIKVALLKSGESVIADVKELVSEDKVCGYLFRNPYTLQFSAGQVFLSEDVNVSSDNENEVNINFSPWIPFTSDKEIPVRPDWLVSIVNPLGEIKKLYEEMVNGQNSEVSSVED
jgi:hypothetical protein